MTQSNPPLEWTDIGRSLGFKLFARLYLSYLIIAPIYVKTYDVQSDIAFVPLLIAVLIVGLSMSGPAICLFGLFTGWLIASSIRRRYERLTQRSALMLGLLICFTITFPLNAILVIDTLRGTDSGLVFLLGLPSTLYILAGAYAGARLYREYPKFISNKESTS